MQTLAGLDATDLGTTAAARRRGLIALSDEALAERLVPMAEALRRVDAERLAADASLPLGEVVASPFGMRAVGLAVAEGATTRHRELRVALVGSRDPAVADPDHDVWDRGVLRTGKYQGFHAESPFAIFDPSHTAKWGPHELTHRAAGFAFAPSMSRFELYLAARLNELVPVALWYGPDQVMRLDDDGFDRRAAGERTEAELSRARFWRGEDLGDLARRTARWLREGARHVDRELAAIDEERATGRRVPVRHAYEGATTIDASSDATAYVVGHEDRLRASASALVEVPARWRADAIDVYRERVEDLFDRLLFAEVTIDPATVDARRAERRAWDRTLRDAQAAATGEPGAELDGSVDGRALEQLAQGLAASVPASFGVDEGALVPFAHSPSFWRRAPLAARWVAHLEDGPRRDLARLEAAILAVGRDDAIERLCEPLGEGGRLVWSDAVEHLALAHDALGAHAHFAETGEPVLPFEEAQHLLVVGFDDGVSVVPVTPELAALVGHGDRDALAAAVAPDPADAWIEELCRAGVLGWRPR